MSAFNLINRNIEAYRPSRFGIFVGMREGRHLRDGLGAFPR